MQISLNWINELVKIQETQGELDNLIEKLTHGGFEIEDIFYTEIKSQKQTILDISATANRSDSLSVQGLSTEIFGLINQPQLISQYAKQAMPWNQIDRNSINFLALIIKNCKKINIPIWLKQKLLSSGITPTNSLTDFQTYVLLETGYTFEFYDFDKICSKLNTHKFNLSIEKAADGKKLLASNNLEYILDDSISLLTANQQAIGIAGLIPVKNFEISASTTNLLIEGSVFNASKIRQQSRKLGLQTDRSLRYEKSLKTNYLVESLYRLISLLYISNSDLICQLHTKKANVKIILPIINLRYKTIKEILGPVEKKRSKYSYIHPKIIHEYLTRLNFNFTFNEVELNWLVEIPITRSDDITREIDLVEEIGRFYGFNNFLKTLPKIQKIGAEDLTYKVKKKLTVSLLNLGLNELIHYSLGNPIPFLENKHSINLINPLILDYGNLRRSLLPNLIKAAQENLKQKNIALEGFEYGHVFLKSNTRKFIEKEYIAGIFGGEKTISPWSKKEITLTWFEAKGKIEQLFLQLDLKTIWLNAKNSKMKELFHPFRSAEIFTNNGISIGIVGQINPILSDQLNLLNETYLFEFDIEPLTAQIQTYKLRHYKSYSLYPKIIKDLSIIIKDDIKFEQICEVLYTNGTKFLSVINLLDEYRGNGIPNNHKSLCFQLIFQSDKKTLITDKIEIILRKLESILEQEFNASLRN